MCVSPSKSRIPLLRDTSPSKNRGSRLRGLSRRRLFIKPRPVAYPPDSAVLFRRVLLVAAGLLLVVLLAVEPALARQVTPSPPLPAPPSPPVPLLLVRQDTHVGSLWLTKLLETQNVLAFHQFDGVCKGGMHNASVAPRVPQALFAEGCGCRGSHTTPRAAADSGHKEQAYCNGECVNPSPCKGVAAMADVLRAKDMMASYGTRRYCGARRAFCQAPKPRVVVLRRDNLVKRAISSLKSDCYARDLTNHATAADVTNVTNPTFLMVDPHLFLVRIPARLRRASCASPCSPPLTAAHRCSPVLLAPHATARGAQLGAPPAAALAPLPARGRRRHHHVRGPAGQPSCGAPPPLRRPRPALRRQHRPWRGRRDGRGGVISTVGVVAGTDAAAQVGARAAAAAAAQLRRHRQHHRPPVAVPAAAAALRPCEAVGAVPAAHMAHTAALSCAGIGPSGGRQLREAKVPGARETALERAVCPMLRLCADGRGPVRPSARARQDCARCRRACGQPVCPHHRPSAGELTEVYNEAMEMGQMPRSMLEGEITLLYKKKDPRDVRNYRPITLLNLDYKILTKVLGARIATTLDSVISAPQNGFVPHRQITDNAHLLSLVQAYLNESNEEGLVVLLDCEKAFDRCSWDYLHASMKELGYGPRLRNWIRLLYDYDAPPRRRIKVNGERGEFFALQSGVAQGCPLSAILFLYVTEGFTRLVEAEREEAPAAERAWHGITIGSREYRISQFADDTVLYLRSFSQLPRMWQVVKIWEEATAMKVNVTKTEALRCGALRGVEFKGAGSEGIAFCKPGEHIISLGVPFSEESGATDDFFRAKYNKMKCLLANWHAIHSMTAMGRAMIAGSLIFSRFRYWAQLMLVPKDVNDAILEDTQALVWNAEHEYDPDVMGALRTSRRWMREGAQYRPKRELGLGLLHWPSHVKALQSKAMLRYLDATLSEYKPILDVWLARGTMGRGAVCSTAPVRLLLKSATPGQRSGLPAFWRVALRTFRELKLTPADPTRCTTCDEAKAEPFWVSLRFRISNTSYKHAWLNTLELKRLQDTHDTDGSAFTTRELEEFYTAWLQTEGRTVLTGGRKTVSFDQLNRQWRGFLRDIPAGLLSQARGLEPKTVGVYSDAARRMMQRMGWGGGPIGKRGEGSEVPAEAVGTGDGSRHGLGYKRRGARKGAGSTARAKLKAVTYDDEGTVTNKYAYVSDSTAKVVELSPRGRPVLTGEELELEESDLIRDVAWWGGGVLGVAELTYPHPNGWTIAGADGSPTLDRLTVNVLTAVYRRKIEKEPTCKQAWEKRLGGAIPWNVVGAYFKGGLLTPKDYASYFKNILHRALLVRTRKPADDGSRKCRCCGAADEHFVHLADCPVLREVWKKLEDIANLKHAPRLVLLGLDGGDPLPGGIMALWLLCWKFAIIAFVQAGIHGVAVDPSSVWEQAVRRLVVRMHARAHSYRKLMIDAEGRGQPPAHHHHQRRSTSC